MMNGLNHVLNHVLSWERNIANLDLLGWKHCSSLAIDLGPVWFEKQFSVLFLFFIFNYLQNFHIVFNLFSIICTEK